MLLVGPVFQAELINFSQKLRQSLITCRVLRDIGGLSAALIERRYRWACFYERLFPRLKCSAWSNFPKHAIVN
jgi:hypothetical protein